MESYIVVNLIFIVIIGNRLVVVLKNRLFVYGIGKEAGVERLMVFDTYDNEHGKSDLMLTILLCHA